MMMREKIALFLALARFTLAQNQPSSTTQDIISELRAGQYQAAKTMLDEALGRQPNDLRLWTLKGFALVRLGNEQEALTAYKHALDLSADYLPALEGAAELEFRKRDPNAASVLERIVKAQPNDQTSHAMLGTLAFEHGKCEEAVKEFSGSRPLIDSRVSALEQYGSCLVKLHRPAEAIPIFEHLTDIQTDKNKSRYNLAVVQSLAGRYSDVISTLGTTTTHDADTLGLLSEAYEAKSDTPHAVNTLREAILAKPDEPRYYVEFANLCLTHASFQVGIEMLNAGLSRMPNSAQLYLARGILYVQMGKYEQSEVDFSQAERLNPNVEYVSSLQGMAELQRNNLDEAESTVRDHLKKAPNDAFLHYLLAETLAKKGANPGTPQFLEAVKSAERAIQLKPNFPVARDVLSRLYLQENNIDKGIEQSRLAYEEDPSDQTALYHLIRALRKGPQTDELPKLVKRLAELLKESREKEVAERNYALVEVKPGSNTSKENKSR